MLVVAPAAEDVIVWDPRRGDAVSAAIRRLPRFIVGVCVPLLQAAVLRGTGKQEVGCVCMSRDGRLVAAGCEEGTLRVWDMSSYQVVVSFRYFHAPSPGHVSFFPYLHTLTHPLSVPPPLTSGHRSAVTCIQFDCSGTRLVSGSKVSI